MFGNEDGAQVCRRENNWSCESASFCCLVLSEYAICLLTFGSSDGASLARFDGCVAFVHTWISVMIIAYENFIPF